MCKQSIRVKPRHREAGKPLTLHEQRVVLKELPPMDTLYINLSGLDPTHVAPLHQVCRIKFVPHPKQVASRRQRALREGTWSTRGNRESIAREIAHDATRLRRWGAGDKLLRRV